MTTRLGPTRQPGGAMSLILFVALILVVGFMLAAAKIVKESDHPAECRRVLVDRFKTGNLSFDVPPICNDKPKTKLKS